MEVLDSTFLRERERKRERERDKRKSLQIRSGEILNNDGCNIATKRIRLERTFKCFDIPCGLLAEDG